MSQGVALYSLGKYTPTKDIFEELYNDPNATINRAGLINNLSIIYEQLGQKNKYIHYLLDAFHEANEENDYDTKLTILRNLYYYYLDIGDHKTALSYLERARNIAMAENDEQQIAIFNAIIGTYYWKIDHDLKKGLEQFRMATSVFNPEMDFNDFLKSHQEMAKLLVELDSLEQAEEILSYTANIASKGQIKKDLLDPILVSWKLHSIKMINQPKIYKAPSHYILLNILDLKNL